MFEAKIVCHEMGTVQNLWSLFSIQFPDEDVEADNEWFEYADVADILKQASKQNVARSSSPMSASLPE
eukprot:10220399-Lingulodinium_polyedra.AAC.1